MNGINHLPDHSRIWIYQSSAPLSADHQETIRTSLKSFTDQWQAHGKTLTAASDILHNHFAVIAIDEQAQEATGCSIDKSMHLVLGLESTLGIELTNRKRIAYRSDGVITTSPMHEFWALRKAGRITGQTPVFDNLIKTLGELKTKWEIPFEESWHQTMWN